MVAVNEAFGDHDSVGFHSANRLCHFTGQGSYLRADNPGAKTNQENSMQKDICIKMQQTKLLLTIALALILVTWDAPKTRTDGTSIPPGTAIGYKIYYGTQTGNYPQTITVGVTGKDPSSYIVGNLTAGVRYYFVLTAYDSSGIESDRSNEVNGIAVGNLPVIPSNLELKGVLP